MAELNKLKEYFLGWQCRLRQHAVRKAEGKPSSGMQATLVLGDKAYGPVNTGLVKKDATEITSEFMHIVRKTHDPNQRQQSAIKLLSSVYYQYPKEFEDCIAATFAVDSELAQRILDAGKCLLHFEQYNQKFELSCDVTDVPDTDVAYKTVFWHNRMFNPVLPAKIKVLKFTPDWQASRADPPVTR